MQEYYTNYEKNKNRSSRHSDIRQFCYLCGIRFDDKVKKQREHVIPKFLIGNKHPLILSACNGCNKCKGYIEDRLNLTFGIYSHNDNKYPASLAIKTIESNVKDGKMGHIKEVFSNTKKEYIKDKSGIYFPQPVHTKSIKNDPNIRVFFYNITKGLHTYYEDRIINWELIDIKTVDIWSKWNKEIDINQITDPNSQYEIWEGVFKYERSCYIYSTVYKFHVYSQFGATIEIKTTK